MAATRILIAQPTAGSVVSGTVGYLMGLVQAFQAGGIAWYYRNLALSDIALSRNVFATFAPARDYSHLLFVWVEDCGGEVWVDAGSRILHYGMRGHCGRYLPRALHDFPGLREGGA